MFRFGLLPLRVAPTSVIDSLLSGIVVRPVLLRLHRNRTDFPPHSMDYFRSRPNVAYRSPQGSTAEPDAKQPKNSTARGTQVYVKNLPETLTKDEFFKLFAKLDDLVGHRLVMRDGKCVGYGFVVFKTKQAAEKAVAALHDKERLSNGKFLYLSMAQQNAIFVNNLHEKVTWTMLTRIFKKYGTVKFVRVIIHERGFNRGYPTGRAIVCFDTSEAAADAIEKVKGRVMYGRTMRVECYKSSYQLRKEKYNKYFSQQEYRKLTTPESNVLESIPDPNDTASIKQTYADRLAVFAQNSHRNFEEIAELLLEYDNDQLEAFFKEPRLLQTYVDNAATLLMIGTLTAV